MGRIVTVSDSAGRSVTVPNWGVAQTSRHHPYPISWGRLRRVASGWAASAAYSHQQTLHEGHYRGFCRHFDCMITKGRRIQCDGSEQEATYEATTRWMSTFNIIVGAESITNFFKKVRELIFKYLFSKHDTNFFFHFTHICNSYIWEGRSLEIFNRFVDM